MSGGQIGNYNYTTQQPTKLTKVPYGKVKMHTRYIVDGIMHPKGVKPIRFKSLKRAENYLRSRGLITA